MCGCENIDWDFAARILVYIVLIAAVAAVVIKLGRKYNSDEDDRKGWY